MATILRPSIIILLIAAVSITASAFFPPSPTTLFEQQQHMDRIIEAMIGITGDLRRWPADFLSSVDEQLGVPLSATIFLPSGYDPVSATAAAATTTTGSGGSNTTTTTDMSPLAMAYHIVPQRLAFSDLLLMKPMSRLPTLLPGNSILILNNSASNFTLDGSRVSEPDLFLSSSIAIHGVSSPLDFSIYGGVYGGNEDSLIGEGGIGSSASAFEFQLLLAAVCGILTIKILF